MPSNDPMFHAYVRFECVAVFSNVETHASDAHMFDHYTMLAPQTMSYSSAMSNATPTINSTQCPIGVLQVQVLHAHRTYALVTITLQTSQSTH